MTNLLEPMGKRLSLDEFEAKQQTAGFIHYAPKDLPRPTGLDVVQILDQYTRYTNAPSFLANQAMDVVIVHASGEVQTLAQMMRDEKAVLADAILPPLLLMTPPMPPKETEVNYRFKGILPPEVDKQLQQQIEAAGRLARSEVRQQAETYSAKPYRRDRAQLSRVTSHRKPK